MGWIRAPSQGQCCPEAPVTPCAGCGTSVCSLFIPDDTPLGTIALINDNGIVGTWMGPFGVGSYQWALDPASLGQSFRPFGSGSVQYGINWHFSGTMNLQ